MTPGPASSALSCRGSTTAGSGERPTSSDPAALDTGLPLITELRSPLFLELAEAHRFETGAVVHVYRPRRDA